MPLKQGPVLGPDNRDLLHLDNTSIRSVYQIPIIRAIPVHLLGHNKKRHLHALFHS